MFGGMGGKMGGAVGGADMVWEWPTTKQADGVQSQGQ